jgi:cell division protease FtsH
MAFGNNNDDPKNDPNGSKPGRTPPTPQGPMTGKSGLLYLFLAIGAIVLFLVYSSSAGNSKSIPISEFMTSAEKGLYKADSIILEDDSISGVKDVKDAPQAAQERQTARISRETKEIYTWKLLSKGIAFKEQPSNPWLMNFVVFWGSTILFVVLIYFIFVRGIRSAGGGAGFLNNFGRSKHKLTNKEQSNVTLNDVAGIEEAKDEVGEIIEFLKNPKKFQRLGGRVPRGVLLIGEPGCGKTLLAKAVAGEADVPFFSISGSDFVEMFVGVGASRVRDLFKQAKESAPCIIFLDEIDAVGRRRGSGFSSGGHDEREQTLNAILVEMDGFDSNDQIIVMAATNRNDVLDPALTRPGRFDRQIHVHLPDLKGRIEILKVHARRIKTGPDVDLERLARATPMFSGADLAAVINEAAISATLANKDFVEQEDMEEAREKVKYGRARKSRKAEEQDRIATAYHEAGHALLQKIVPYADPLHKVTIIPRGQSLGSTMFLPERDRDSHGARWMQAHMRVLCGGRIAEQRKTGDTSSGASMDISMATNFARAMVLRFGMSDRLGFINYAGNDTRQSFVPEKDYSDVTARIIDEEIKRFIDEAYDEAERLIAQHWDKVEAIAEALLKLETLSADDVDRIMRGDTIARSSITDLLKNEQNKRPTPKPPAAQETTGDQGADGPVPAPA